MCIEQVWTHVANRRQLLPQRFALFDEWLFLRVFTSIIDCELCTQNIGPETNESYQMHLSEQIWVHSLPCKTIASTNQGGIPKRPNNKCPKKRWNYIWPTTWSVSHNSLQHEIWGCSMIKNPCYKCNVTFVNPLLSLSALWTSGSEKERGLKQFHFLLSAFFTADHFICHNRKSTGVTNKMRVLFTPGTKSIKRPFFTADILTCNSRKNHRCR